MPKPRSPHALLWEPPSRSKPVLTRDDLVRAALAVLDDGGFDGLTMRTLAQRLGVQAASLYNHIRDKRDVLTLVADAIVAEVRRPVAVDAPWYDKLYWVAYDYREVLLAHRDAARVLAETPPIGPNRLRLMDDVLGILREAGFSDESVADAGWLFNTYVTGFVLDEQTQIVPAAQAAAEQHADMAAWLRELPSDQFPNILAVAGPLVDGAMERRVIFGLNTLLEGLKLAPSTAGG